MIHVLTVGHKRFDTRIWVKEIASLKAAGIPVRYIVADGAGDETVDGVEIRDFGPIPERSGFKRRMGKMYAVVRNCGLKSGDVVHFHDGAFLPFAFLLWLRGCRVIYDVHEDYPRQVLNSRFAMPIKRVWSWILLLLESLAGKLFHGFVAATPTIAARFPAHKTVTVQNFPLMEELQVSDPKPLDGRPLHAVYVGGLSVVRGVRQMLNAIELAAQRIRSIKLVLGGDYSPSALRDELIVMPGWSYTEEMGWLERGAIAKVLSDARVGLVLLHPTKNYPDAYPVKLFEYMSAGIPVIASDFPLWRQIVEGSGCGLLVDPLNPEAIADAMCWLIEHPKEAEEMGRRGREAVERKFNWGIEEAKLLSFYLEKKFVES
jgi:glycosyltransferase involved in cell wall biosynthesis